MGCGKSKPKNDVAAGNTITRKKSMKVDEDQSTKTDNKVIESMTETGKIEGKVPDLPALVVKLKNEKETSNDVTIKENHNPTVASEVKGEDIVENMEPKKEDQKTTPKVLAEGDVVEREEVKDMGAVGSDEAKNESNSPVEETGKAVDGDVNEEEISGEKKVDSGKEEEISEEKKVEGVVKEEEVLVEETTKDQESKTEEVSETVEKETETSPVIEAEAAAEATTTEATTTTDEKENMVAPPSTDEKDLRRNDE